MSRFRFPLSDQIKKKSRREAHSFIPKIERGAGRLADSNADLESRVAYAIGRIRCVMILKEERDIITAPNTQSKLSSQFVYSWLSYGNKRDKMPIANVPLCKVPIPTHGNHHNCLPMPGPPKEPAIQAMPTFPIP